MVRGKLWYDEGRKNVNEIQLLHDMGKGGDTAMAGKGRTGIRIVILLFAAVLAAQVCVPAAFAEDEELMKELPGQWVLEDDAGDEGEETRQYEAAALALEGDGKMSLRFSSPEGEYLYTCEGTWTSELVPGGLDRLTLAFTSTDNPQKAGNEYSAECVYDIYAEGWVENDTRITALILEPAAGSAVSPFEEATGFDSVALYRRQGPNMRVVNCISYVSLRAKRSKNSARLAKVPLGALVLAFPEAGDGNGFTWCVYQDKYGYILAEYLEPVE